MQLTIRMTALCALLALAACSPPASNTAPAGSTDTAGSGAPAADAGSAPAAGGAPQLGPVIHASEMPHPRAGLWRTVETAAGEPARTREHCKSGQARDLNMGAGCQTATINRTLTGGFVLAAHCTGNGIDMTMSIHGEGDFTNHYSTDKSVTNGGAHPTPPKSSHTEANYVGPCPAGESDDSN